MIRGSKFSLDGHVKNYRSKSPSWNTEVSANIAPRELLELIPNVTEHLQTAKISVRSNGALTLRAKVQGNFQKNRVQFALIADKTDHMVLEAPFGQLHQPPGVPLTFDGIVTIDRKGMDIGDTHLLLGETLIMANGAIDWSSALAKGEKHAPPTVELNLRAPQETPVDKLVAIFNPLLADQITGNLSGSFSIQGKLDRPTLKGRVDFESINAPAFKIQNLSGYIKGGKKKNPVTKAVPSGDEWIAFPVDKATPIVLVLDKADVSKLPVRDLSAQLSFKAPDDKIPLPRIAITNGEAKLADGSMAFGGWVDFNTGSVYAKTSIEDTSAEVLSHKLTGHPNEITGVTHAVIELKTRGEQSKELLENMNGSVKLVVEDGMVSRFGHLQTRLTQYNLITQGIFGFNLNNLLQSVWPVRTGRFDTLSYEARIRNGTINIEELRYQGPDMRLWGNGRADLEDNTLELEIAGKIPRVSQSMLGGSLGSMSRRMTLQKAMKVMTMGKLQSLPSLPVLGAIATDKPRTFMFDVAAPLDKPNLVARSIEKSFKWLPNKPTATAHPVPGIDFKAAY